MDISVCHNSLIVKTWGFCTEWLWVQIQPTPEGSYSTIDNILTKINNTTVENLTIRMFAFSNKMPLSVLHNHLHGSQPKSEIV